MRYHEVEYDTENDNRSHESVYQLRCEILPYGDKYLKVALMPGVPRRMIGRYYNRNQEMSYELDE